MTLAVRVFLFAGVVCGTAVHAQTWDTVRALQTGAPVKVLETGGAEHKGTLAAVGADSVTVRTGKTEVAVERSRVRRVQVRSGARRARNIAIGAGVGLAVGLVVDGTLGAYLRNESGDQARPLFYVAPIGLFGGIGAALSPYRTVYRIK
jgi:hypothetical protein